MAITAEQARRAPKVLLHDHLDGGLRPTTAIELADAIGWTLPSTDPVELQAWFTRGADTNDILQYLATFEHTLAVMQSADSIERVAAEAVEDLAADGVVYAEVRFAPELHTRRRALAPRGGRGRHHRLPAWRGRRTSERSADHRQRDLLRHAHRATIDGDRPSRRRAPLGRRQGGGVRPRGRRDRVASVAARRGARVRAAQHLNITVHASEPPDLELISDALAHGAHRIGHGVRLKADTRPAADGGLELGTLAQYVLDRQVHLEMAPTCNVQIGAVDSIADHPIGPLLRAGFNVGINTDNRLMSGVLPSSELGAVAAAFSLSWHEIERLVDNALSSSFAPYDVRERIRREQVAPWFDTVRGG
jgi:adenosine deaminase